MGYPDAVRAAGFDGDGPALGDALFDAILAGEDGELFTRHRHDEAWDLIRTPDQKIQLEIPELLDELARLGASPASYLSDGFPFVLSAGERRSFTANTIVRDPSWRRKDPEGALRNGMGLDYAADGGEPKPTGVSPNELTSSDWCDPIAGTPWHKHVPARVEPLPA
jgi:hypothetical protein